MRFEPFERRNTRQVRCGSLAIGGGGPISIQTMTKTDTRDPVATVDQVNRAVDAGAEIVRVAVPDMEAAQALHRIVRAARCPIVADIHFDYRLAIASIEAGAAKVRINPGNLGSADKLLAVAASAKERGAAIRVGVNGGSVDKDLLEKHGGPTPEALVESAARSLDLLAAEYFDDIVISLKSSSVRDTVKAYSLMAQETDLPFHIGITEAGPGTSGVVKSASGISALLALGLGDTVRVSLTGDPVEEVWAAREILQAAGVRRFRPELVSCPTCGRTQVDLIPIAKEVDRRLLELDVPITVAVMGCPVNGPGEAKEADAGVACGRDGGILFSHGKVLGRVKQEEIVESRKRVVEEEADRFRRGSSVGHNR